MSDSTPHNVKDLLSLYSFRVADNSVVNDLHCIICHKLMIDACQGLCGCHYCHRCISRYLQQDNRYCPGGKQDCKEDYLVLETGVFKNPRLDAKISHLKVHCLNNSCLSIIPMDGMSDHLRVCTQQPMGCPYSGIGCDNDRATKEKISNHLNEEILPHTELLIEFVHVLKNEIDALRKDVEGNRREISYLRETVKERDIQIMKMIEEIAKQRTEFEGHKEDSRLKEERIVILEEQLIEVRHAMITDSDTSMKEAINLSTNFDIVTTDSNMWTDKVRSRFKDFEGDKRLLKNIIKLCPIIEAEYIWRIDKFSEKLKTMKDKRIFSDPFYSNNYKLCLYIYIDADNICLCCMLMRGDHDDQVQWPMRRTVTLSIVNQYTLHPHHSVTMTYDTFYDKTTFDRPLNTMNDCGIGYYYDWFMKNSSIRDKSSIVVDDSIVVSCVINDP